MPDEKYGSQYGEDEFFKSQFPADYKGRVLEIGAWNPIVFSNSRKLIDAGWEAVLVEPTPRAVEKLLLAYGNNPKVKIISGCVELMDRAITMRVTEDAVSSSDPNVVRIWERVGGYYATMTVAAFPIAELVMGVHFDVISIDAEGHSVDILRNILILTQPDPAKVICVEFDNRAIEVHKMCLPSGYRVVIDEHANGTNMILVKAEPIR